MLFIDSDMKLTTTVVEEEQGIRILVASRVSVLINKGYARRTRYLEETRKNSRQSCVEDTTTSTTDLDIKTYKQREHLIMKHC